MTTAEGIATLKKPELARPYWMRSKKDRAVLFEAGPEGTLLVSYRCQEGRRHIVETSVWCEHLLILKDTYKPEPEYVDCEVVAHELETTGIYWLYCMLTSTSKLALELVVARADFVGFYVDAGTPGERRVSLDDVATAIREGKSVVARFVKE